MSDMRKDGQAPSFPRWMQAIWTSPWPWMVVVVGAFCLPLFIGLERADLENDEAMYSFAVDVMLDDGDWLTPKSIPSETTPFLEKPPLKMWMVALPIGLGWLPQNEFGYRLTDALMGSLAMLYVFAIGRRMAGPIAGVGAVMLLFAHGPLLFMHGIRTNNMESALVLAYAGGVYHFLAWRSVNPDVKRHVIAMAMWFVIGFMTKFVAALFLPAILAVAALATHADRARLYRDWRTFALTAALAAGAIAPWFVYQYLHQPSFLQTILGTHVLTRFTSSLDPAHLQPWHFYLATLWDELAGNGTRVLSAVGVAFVTARTFRRRWVDGLVVLLWLALPITAISVGTSKLYHYAYPFLPPVTIAAGCVLAFGAKWTFSLLARTSLPAILNAAMIAGLIGLALPIGAYRANLGQLQTAAAPMQQVRACLSGVVSTMRQEGLPAPGVWVEAHTLSWVSFYYLRDLGPWSERDVPSDATVVTNLIDSRSHRPVLLSNDMKDAFRARLRTNRQDVLDRTRQKTGFDSDTIESALSTTPVGTVPVPGGTLFLPGRFATCAADRETLDGR